MYNIGLYCIHKMRKDDTFNVSRNHQIYFVNVFRESVNDSTDRSGVKKCHRRQQNVFQHFLVQLKVSQLYN